MWWLYIILYVLIGCFIAAYGTLAYEYTLPGDFLFQENNIELLWGIFWPIATLIIVGSLLYICFYNVLESIYKKISSKTDIEQ